MQSKHYRKLQVGVIAQLFLLISWGCSDSRSFFVSEVNEVAEPEEVIDLDLEKVETDNAYSHFFAVYDSLLISCRPNSNGDIFYVTDLNNDELLGSFLKRGEGPTTYLGLNPITRIERKNGDLVTLTYESVKRELIEWNITKTLESGRDSIIRLGNYGNSNDLGLTYSGIYMISDSTYLGYTPSFYDKKVYLHPIFSVLDDRGNSPAKNFSFVREDFSIEEAAEATKSIFSGVWSLSPDNTKIVHVMNCLEQINIIDLDSCGVRSYRVDGSPDESLFKTDMKKADYQYHHVVCNDNAIYTLYHGDDWDDFSGCMWLHEYDWNGNFKKKYRLPLPIMCLWLDPSSDTLYGYYYPEDAIYRLKI